MDFIVYGLIAAFVLLIIGIAAAKVIKNKYGVNTDIAVNIMEEAKSEVISEIKDRVVKNQAQKSNMTLIKGTTKETKNDLSDNTGNDSNNFKKELQDEVNDDDIADNDSK